MCGFLLSNIKSNDSLNKHSLNNLLKMQSHRGPDVNKYLISDNLIFFHNRLKIIDLSDRANQPFVSKKTGNIIIFNGEIYNFKKLKKFLKKRKLETSSDTEVILNLYEKFGDNFVKKLNGIFSFVIYDKRKKIIYSARDRFGIKPLMLYHDRKRIAYSTEIKPIIKIINKKEINLSNIKKYISEGLLYDDNQTFFKNVNYQPASTYFKFSLNSFKFIKKEKYWKLEKNKKLQCKNFNKFFLDFKKNFKNAIKLNLVSDVKLGLLYSSGSDSSFIKNFLKKELKVKLSTFTFGWANKKYDEISHLKKLNEKIDFPTYVSTKDILKNLQKMIFMNEGPIGGFGTAAIYQLMNKIKKKKIKVVLSGEGGDEFLLGYRNQHIIFLRELYKKNKKKFRSELLMYNKNNGSNFKEKEFMKYSNNFLTNEIMTPDALRMNDEDLLKNNYKIKIKKFSKLNQVVKNYAFYSKLPKLLSFLDKCSGAHGIECRVPYLDHNFVTFLYSNEDEFKIKNGSQKYPQKKWLNENKFLTYVSKLNVATPQREYFKKQATFKKIIKIINNGNLVKLNLLNFERFKIKYEKYLKNKKLGNSFFVWKILNAELFLKSFFPKLKDIKI